jgi:ribonuclease J
MTIGDRVPGDYVFVDGSLVGEVGPMVMRQRDALSQSGFVTAVVRYDRQAGKAVDEPRLITRGFVYAPDAEDLLARAKDVARGAASVRRGTAAAKVEEKVERALADFFYRETKRKPVVTAALIEV